MINSNLVKCAITLGILFFVLSHPYLYRVFHRQFYKVMAFCDERMCPTEGGVLVHAIIFALIIYFGKTSYDNYLGEGKNKKQNKKNNNEPVDLNKNNNNKIFKNK